MHRLLLIALGLSLLAASRWPRTHATAARSGWPRTLDAPFAPSPAAVRFLSMGYGEVTADLLWIRLIGYIGGDDDTADNAADLTEAVAAADPKFKLAYDWGVRAILVADHGKNPDNARRALAIAERGFVEFPSWWAPVRLAGDIYLQDLAPKDEAEKRRYDERGAELLERSARMPDAPIGLANTLSAEIWTRLGQHDRAVNRLREAILTAPNELESARLVRKLAELENANVADLASELSREKRSYEARWLAERPLVPVTIYVLLGASPAPYVPVLEIGNRDTLASQLPPAVPALPDDAIGESALAR